MELLHFYKTALALILVVHHLAQHLPSVTIVLKIQMLTLKIYVFNSIEMLLLQKYL